MRSSRTVDGRRLLALAVLTCLVAGCLFPDRGTAIANDIRDDRHPMIASVEYGGDDDESGPWMDIVLQPGTTKEQAQTVACDVVKPAIERGSPPPDFGFAVVDSDGNVIASDLTPCP